MKHQVYSSIIIKLILTLYFCSNTVFAQYNDHDISTAFFNQIMLLKPNLKRGEELYSLCTTCHQSAKQISLHVPIQQQPFYPQLASQHRSVLIKQMTEFSLANNRTIPPHIIDIHLISAQDIANVSAFASSIPAVVNTVGYGNDLELGKDLYRVHCAKCHGKNAQGDDKEIIPRLQSQNYHYMLDQFIKIRDGLSMHVNHKMKSQISRFTFREMTAVIDYVSRLTSKKGSKNDYDKK